MAQTYQYFGKTYFQELEPNQVLKETRNDAEAQVKRLRQALQDADSTGDINTFLFALCRERNLYPETVLQMMMGQERDTLLKIKQETSDQKSHNAAQKGKVWREAAIEQWNEKHHLFNSLSDFCESIGRRSLTTTDERTETAPKSRQGYDVMREARKEGHLSD